MIALIVVLTLALPVGSFLFWLWRRSRREPVYLAEQLDIGRVIGRTFSVFTPRNLPLVGAAAIFLGVPRLLSAIVMPARSSAMALTPAQTANPFQAFEAMGPMMFAAFGVGVALLLVGLLFQITATIVLVGQYEGEPIALGWAFRRMPVLILPMIGMLILMILGISLGMILFVWPGILLILSWSVAFPVLVSERLGVIDSLKRSRELAIGSRGRILLIFILFYAAMMVLLVPMGMTAVLAGGAPSGVVMAVIQFAWSVVGGLIGCSLPAALYVELRQIRAVGGARGLAEVFA